MKTLLLLLTISLFACKSNNSKWTDQDKKNAYNNCMFGKAQGFTDEQWKKRCDCFVEKVMAISPDPAKQGEIPMTEVRKLNDECDAAAKK